MKRTSYEAPHYAAFSNSTNQWINIARITVEDVPNLNVINKRIT